MRGKEFVSKVPKDQIDALLTQMEGPNAVIRRGIFGGRSFEVKVRGETAKISLNAIIQQAIALKVSESDLVERIKRIDKESCTSGSGLVVFLWKMLHAVRSALFGHAARRESFYAELQTIAGKEIEKSILPCDQENQFRRYVRWQGKEEGKAYLSVSRHSYDRTYLVCSSLDISRSSYAEELKDIQRLVNEEIRSHPETKFHLVTAAMLQEMPKELTPAQQALIKGYVYEIPSLKELEQLVEKVPQGGRILVRITEGECCMELGLYKKYGKNLYSNGTIAITKDAKLNYGKEFNTIPDLIAAYFAENMYYPPAEST